MSTSFKKRETQEVSRRSRAVTGKKRRKKRDALANGFFANLNLLLLFFCCSRCRRHHRCLAPYWLYFTYARKIYDSGNPPYSLRLLCKRPLVFLRDSNASEIRKSHLSFFASKIVAKFGQKIACMNSPNNVPFLDNKKSQNITTWALKLT